MEEPITNTQSPRKDDSIPAGLAIVAIIRVAADLRPGIVSIGPVLPSIREAFEVSILTRRECPKGVRYF